MKMGGDWGEEKHAPRQAGEPLSLVRLRAAAEGDCGGLTGEEGRNEVDPGLVGVAVAGELLGGAAAGCEAAGRVGVRCVCERDWDQRAVGGERAVGWARASS